MTSVNYIKDDTGSTFIPSSQRPDGSWRRPIRVKDGYVPQEEQPLYVSKGKQVTSSPYPVGLSADDISSYSSNTNSSKGQRGGASSSFYFDVGFYDSSNQKANNHPIPGLNFVETPVPEKTSSKSRAKKSKNKNKSTEPTEDSSGTTIGKKSISQNNSQSTVPAPTTTTTTTDPVKRLRNLRKKLKDIEALEKKIDSGELKNPEKEQLEKIQRKDEVIDEVDDLERLIEHLNLS